VRQRTELVPCGAMIRLPILRPYGSTAVQYAGALNAKEGSCYASGLKGEMRMRKATLSRLHVMAVALFAIVVAACAAAQRAEVRQDAPQQVKQATPEASPQTKEVKRDVPYVPTPQNVVNEMLTLANVTKNDVVYDLGCGDGRLVITAVSKFGAIRGFGVDIDPQRIAESNANAKAAGVTDRVAFAVQDLFQTD